MWTSAMSTDAIGYNTLVLSWADVQRLAAEEEPPGRHRESCFEEGNDMPWPARSAFVRKACAGR